MNTCPYRAIDTRLHIYPNVRACTRRWLQTNADGAADARVCAHLGTPRCTSVDTDAHCTDGHITPARVRTRTRTHAHAHAPMESTRTLIRTHVLIRTQMYARSDKHVSWARTCAAPAAYAHDRHLHGIYTYIHVHVHALTHIHTHMVIHMSRLRGRVAPLERTRTRTHAHR